MYCSSCGTALIQGLNYCKNCGARVGGAKTDEAGKLSESSFNLLVAAVLAIPIVGLGIIIGLMSVMKKELDFDNQMIIVIVSMSFLLLLVSEGVLVWLLIQRTRKVKENAENPPSKDNAQLNEVVIKGLNAAKTRELVEPPPSVIDETTRHLEPIPLEIKKR
jgi:hypothetical protein